MSAKVERAAIHGRTVQIQLLARCLAPDVWFRFCPPCKGR